MSNNAANSSDATFIRTVNLCRYYRPGPHEVRAVDNVDISISRGEFVAIVGASGSGKSTVLNLMAGLDTPTAGSVVIENIALESLNRRELSEYRAQRVGMVFQSFNLIGHRTALGNVELALYFDDTPRGDRARKATEILERLGLGDRLDHRPADLSGGEQQRVAIARALVKRPQLLFADEPTGNLDYENSRAIVSLLTELNRDGLTVVMVTHNLDLAQKHADRIIQMHYGRIVSPSSATGETA
jgi:putative ABC transport system ATP-binding protein